MWVKTFHILKYLGNFWTNFIFIFFTPFESIGGTMDRNRPLPVTMKSSTSLNSLLNGPGFDFGFVFTVNAKNGKSSVHNFVKPLILKSKIRQNINLIAQFILWITVEFGNKIGLNMSLIMDHLPWYWENS